MPVGGSSGFARRHIREAEKSRIGKGIGVQHLRGAWGQPRSRFEVVEQVSSGSPIEWGETDAGVLGVERVGVRFANLLF